MCWSADSKEIIFAASTNYSSRAYQESHASLYRVSISGGDASKISPDNHDYGNPVMSDEENICIVIPLPVNTNKIYDLNKLVSV
jgi:Tol biopolymer transport system component